MSNVILLEARVKLCSRDDRAPLERFRAGFTLLELLVAMTMVVTILGLIGNAMISSSRAVNQIVSMAELIEDARVSGLMLADSLGRARYVYPPGLSLTLGSTQAYSVENPRTGSNVWTIGTDPIIAFVEAAANANPTVGCKPGLTVPTATESEEACLKFTAFYPVKRSSLTASAQSASNPGVDGVNDSSAWVLMEYQAVLDLKDLAATASTATPGKKSGPPPTVLSGAKGRMVADYVATKGVSITYSQCQTVGGAAGATSLSVAACANASSVDYRSTVILGSFTVQPQVKRNGHLYQTVPLSFPIAPRNVYQGE